MPIYEYKCMKCNKEFEYILFGSNDPVLCPECESDEVKRCMSACSFKTSGGGPSTSTGSSSSGCASCSGGNCAACH